MSHITSRRQFFGLIFAGSLAVLLHPSAALAHARRKQQRGAAPAQRRRFGKAKEREAWVDGKGMCVFPFAADRLPDTADAFAAAMERGYRRSLKLPADTEVVRTTGDAYPFVESMKVDFCDAVVDTKKEGRKPSDKYLTVHALDADRLEVLGHRMAVEGAEVNIGMTAAGARLLLARDKQGKPLLVLGDAREGRMTFDMRLDDVEKLLLAAARKGGRAYGLSVDRTRLRMTVENRRTIRVDLKLFTRVAIAPAGLRFRARLDIDDRLDGTLSELSCTGDEVLGPLISGLISPVLKKYNGKTRPLMNFPATDMRLRDIRITADQSIRATADFGSGK